MIDFQPYQFNEFSSISWYEQCGPIIMEGRFGQITDTEPTMFCALKNWDFVAKNARTGNVV